MKPLIGMCVMDRPGITERAINMLLEHTKRVDFEWAVLDQNSGDQTKEMLGRYKSWFDHYSTNEWNTGIIFGHNYLMSLRKPGQTYIKWDSDCHVMNEDWLNLIKKTLDYPEIGSALCRRPTFWIDSVPSRMPFYNDKIVVEDRGGLVLEILKAPDGVCGCTWAIRGDVLDEFGYFNEDTNMDDIDYPVRMFVKGYLTAYVPDAAILQPQEDCINKQSMAAKTFINTKWDLEKEYHRRFMSGKDLTLGSRFDSKIPMSLYYLKKSDEAWEWFKEYRDGMELNR